VYSLVSPSDAYRKREPEHVGSSVGGRVSWKRLAELDISWFILFTPIVGATRFYLSQRTPVLPVCVVPFAVLSHPRFDPSLLVTSKVGLIPFAHRVVVPNRHWGVVEADQLRLSPSLERVLIHPRLYPIPETRPCLRSGPCSLSTALERPRPGQPLTR